MEWGNSHTLCQVQELQLPVAVLVFGSLAEDGVRRSVVPFCHETQDFLDDSRQFIEWCACNSKAPELSGQLARNQRAFQ